MFLTVDWEAQMNRSQIEQLANEIEYHNIKYWIEHSPEISDEEFDELVRKLRVLDPNHPILYKRYHLLKDGKKIKHKKPVLSLNKGYTISEAINYLKSISRDKDEIIHISPKFDGIHGILYYRHILVTRGDGETGDDISDKLKNIKIYTNKVKLPDIFHGELIFKNSYFEKIRNEIKRKDGGTYKTPRNAVAGILSTLGKIDDKIMIDFVDFDLYARKLSVEELEDGLPAIVEEFRKLDYAIDGIVLKIDDEDYFESLGHNNSFYHGAIAYKFSNKRVVTKLIDVRWTNGLDNTLIPTAILEPVEINGVTINKVSLHNAKYILDNDIKIGSLIEIERKGDAVPVIVDIHHSENESDIVIEHCPNCGSNQLHYDEPHLYCLNPNCSGNVVKQISIGLKRLKFENIGEKIVEKLVSSYNISTIEDLLGLSYEHFSKLSLKAVHRKIVERLNKPVYDYQLLSALCLKGLGPELSKRLCKEMTIDELVENLHIGAIDGIGFVRGSIIIDNIDEICARYQKLKSHFKYVIEISKQQEQNITVCLSGTFPKPKSHYQQILESYGINTINNLNKSVSYLIIPHKNHTSTKVEKAQRLNIPTKTIDEFLEELNDKHNH